MTIRGTIKVKLVAVQDGMYTNYVFQNLDECEQSKFRYITVTRCPNWQVTDSINLGDEGYLEYEFAEAGDPYYDLSSSTTKNYKYTAFYFINFIQQTIDKTKEFKF